MTTPRLRLGRTVATPGALAVMERLRINPVDLLTRHVAGDWGDIGPDDRALNERALLDGSRIFSMYGKQDADDCLWIITDAEDDAGVRFVTTILRPEDY